MNFIMSLTNMAQLLASQYPDTNNRIMSQLVHQIGVFVICVIANANEILKAIYNFLNRPRNSETIS